MAQKMTHAQESGEARPSALPAAVGSRLKRSKAEEPCRDQRAQRTHLFQSSVCSFSSFPVPSMKRMNCSLEMKYGWDHSCFGLGI